MYEDDVYVLSGALETLEHRRDRLQEILTLGMVSMELARQVRGTLAEIERRLEELRPRQDWTSRRAA